MSSFVSFSLPGTRSLTSRHHSCTALAHLADSHMLTRKIIVAQPGEPDNYASSLDRDRADDFPFLHQPRVVTVSHPATHPSPPSHGSTVDEVVVEATEPGESSENAKVPPEQDVSRHRRRRLDRTLVESQSQSTSSKLESEPESSSSNSSRNGHSRSLNSDERRGLVMLAGILAGGWLLGGLGLRRREKVQVQA